MTEEIPTTGPEAIAHALQNLDLDALEASQKEVISSKVKTRRPRAVRMLHIIQGLRKNKMDPSNLMINRVPVIPPKFRPFSITGNTFLPGDANEVYRDLLEYRRLYGRTEESLGREGSSEVYMDMNNAVKAAYGYGDSPNPKTKARGVKGFFKMVTGTSPKYCYDDKTEILTRRGWILFKDLEKDDQVGSIDGDSHDFVWSNYENPVDTPYEGLMVKFDRRRQSLLVTPNHRMRIRKRKKNELVDSDEFMQKNWEVVDAARLVYPSNRIWTQTATPVYSGGNFKLPTSHDITPEDWAILVGWYVSEGNLCGDSHETAVVWQADVNIPYCVEIEGLVKRLTNAGVKVVKWEKKQTTGGKCWGWAIHNREIATWLSANVGHTSHKKKLSSDIRSWPKDLLTHLMLAYLKGDGKKRNYKVELPRNHYTHKLRNSLTDEHGQFSTVSLRLFGDLQEIAFKLGLTIVRVSEKSSKAGRYGTNTVEIYVGSVIGRWNFTSDNQTPASWEHYKGRVYCVQVPTGLLVVRREGKVCVSGNSFYQEKVLSKPVDTVGRSVIIPDADLGMDEVGIPEDMAWKMYGSHVQRDMVRGGMSPTAAMKAIKDRTPQALTTLEKRMPDHPVVITRSPSWHKFNLAGQTPRLVKGDAIRINTYITDGMNADFNGDQQIGKILVLCDKSTDYNNQFLTLQCRMDDAMVTAMTAKQMIPAFNRKDKNLFLVEMEDFPRGKKLGENPNGKNGHIDFFEIPSGLQVVAYNEAMRRPIWTSATVFSVHYQREIEIVELSNGRQIVTDDDPRAVYGVDPTEAVFSMGRFTPTDALNRKVVVPCVKDVAAACIMLGATNQVTIGEAKVDLDYDFGYLLGSLCGDGWWDKKFYGSKKKKCYLSDLKGFNAAAAYATLNKLFGKVSWGTREFNAADLPDRYGDTVSHTFASGNPDFTHFVEFCARWMGGEGDENTSGSGNKHIPDFFLLSPEKFRRGLLSGLFDTDGSCSVSNAKEKPQLLCAFTSTSFRLVSDVKFLCLTLGVRAHVTFSKNTSGGNTSWICNVSTPDAKRKDLFSRLYCPWKRDNFINTHVSADNTSLVHDKVVVADSIYKRIARDLPSPKITTAERAAGGAEVDAKKVQQNMYQQWREASEKRIISRSGARAVLEHLRGKYTEGRLVVAAAITDLSNDDDNVSKPRGISWVAACRFLCAPEAMEGQKTSAAKAWRIARSAAHTGAAQSRRRNNLIKALKSDDAYTPACVDPDILAWERDIVENETMAWATVTDVQYTGMKEDGYDLTVPGYETFMSADGVILSNTMSVHLPAGKDAIKDVQDNLMASKMLWSIKDRNTVLPTPKHEQILGLEMGKDKGGKTRKFATEEEAMKAINDGTIDLNDEVKITNK